MPVKCQRCGAENPAAARFCMSCGNALPVVDDAPAAPPETAAPQADVLPAASPEPAAPPPPTPAPLPAQFSRRPSDPNELPPTHPDWKMSPAGDLPDPPKRRIWLWVLGGIAAVLLLCVVMMILSSIVGTGLDAPAGP